MELILQQMPIVVHSLNIGFLQTLRLFLVTLIGAFQLYDQVYVLTSGGPANSSWDLLLHSVLCHSLSR